jgi:hypothetical protein
MDHRNPQGGAVGRGGGAEWKQIWSLPLRSLQRIENGLGMPGHLDRSP